MNYENLDEPDRLIFEELKRQELHEAAHFFVSTRQKKSAIANAGAVQVQAMWSIAALETRIRRLESAAGLEHLGDRVFPDEEGLEAVETAIKLLESDG